MHYDYDRASEIEDEWRWRAKDARRHNNRWMHRGILALLAFWACFFFSGPFPVFGPIGVILYVWGICCLIVWPFSRKVSIPRRPRYVVFDAPVQPYVDPVEVD